MQLTDRSESYPSASYLNGWNLVFLFCQFILDPLFRIPTAIIGGSGAYSF